MRTGVERRWNAGDATRRRWTTRIASDRASQRAAGQGVADSPGAVDRARDEPSPPGALVFLAGWFVANGSSPMGLVPGLGLSGTIRQGISLPAKGREGDRRN